jgi:hypothetical protein
MVRAKWLQRSVWAAYNLFEFREANLPGYELGSRGIGLSRVFGIGSCRVIARKELGCEQKTSYVI